MAWMATGSGRPAVDRPGVDFQVQLQVSWNAPEAYVTLDSDGIYELKTSRVSDILGLCARRPGAVVVNVMSGFHDVTLLDMGDVEGPRWVCGGRRVARVLPGHCRSHPAITV